MTILGKTLTVNLIWNISVYEDTHDSISNIVNFEIFSFLFLFFFQQGKKYLYGKIGRRRRDNGVRFMCHESDKENIVRRRRRKWYMTTADQTKHAWITTWRGSRRKAKIYSLTSISITRFQIYLHSSNFKNVKSSNY